MKTATTETELHPNHISVRRKAAEVFILKSRETPTRFTRARKRFVFHSRAGQSGLFLAKGHYFGSASAAVEYGFADIMGGIVTDCETGETVIV